MIGESTLLSETEDPIERALLLEARDYRASDRARAATLAALGLHGGPSGGGTSGSGALGAGKVVLALAVVGAAAAVVYFAFADPKPPVTTSAPTAPIVTAPTVTASIAESSAAPVESAAPPATAVVSVAVPSASMHTPAPRDTGPSLADEILLIDRARSALYDHDKEGSLRALDEYDKRFPPSKPGRMAPEAKSLRERALRLP